MSLRGSRRQRLSASSASTGDEPAGVERIAITRSTETPYTVVAAFRRTPPKKTVEEAQPPEEKPAPPRPRARPRFAPSRAILRRCPQCGVMRLSKSASDRFHPACRIDGPAEHRLHL